MVFRRRRERAEADDLEDEGLEETGTDEADAASDDAAGEWAVAAPVRPQGPWDIDDVPEDEVPRVDLGAMHVAVADGMEVRLDVQDQVVVAATLVDGHSSMQIHAFAAPKSSGIWREVRQEIAESLRSSGGEAQDTDGPFGVELKARIPVDTPDQGRVLQPSRFLGVDGPRWFLRGLMTGPAATDPNQASRLEHAFRNTVVVRGAEAMAPRELLPLHLPKDAVEQPPPEPPKRPGLEMLERGPEITEIQ